MKSRSENCKHYTDRISILVDANVTVPGMEDTCTVSVSKFSCQQRNTEAPDDITLSNIKTDAVQSLVEKGCTTATVDNVAVAFETQQLGLLNPEFSAEKLLEKGAVSNCFAAGQDINDMLHRAEGLCYPTKSMRHIPSGKIVTNYHMKTTSSLFACDISKEAMPQVEEDIKKVAAQKLKNNNFEIDPEDLSCYISVLPLNS